MTMKLKVQFVAILMLLLAPSWTVAQSNDVSVIIGGVQVLLPIPNGYVTAMGVPSLRTFGNTITPPENRLLAYLVSKGELDAFVEGRDRGFGRYFIAQVARNTENYSASQSSFMKLKESIRRDHEDQLRKAESRFPRFWTRYQGS